MFSIDIGISHLIFFLFVSVKDRDATLKELKDFGINFKVRFLIIHMKLIIG